VAAHLSQQVRRWLIRKRKKQGSKRARYSDLYLHETLGLLQLRRRPNRYSWATV
jgi:hypothetical protein